MCDGREMVYNKLEENGIFLNYRVNKLNAVSVVCEMMKETITAEECF